MKRILLILFCGLLGGPLFSQTIPTLRPEPSLERIVLGVAPGADLSEVARVLEAERCFLPLDERNQLAGGRYLLAWLDPSSPALPRDGAALYALLDRLQRDPALRFAHPFLLSPNGALFGVTDEVLVKLRQRSDLPRLQTLARQLSCDLSAESEFIPRLYRLRVHTASASDPVSLAVWLRDLDAFEYVDLNYLVNPIVATNDPFFVHQWSLENNGTVIQGNGTAGADMSVTDAWNITTGSPNVRIAIIDSGTDTTHPDLVGNLLPGYDASGGSSQGYPNTNFDEDAHGTNCAGIVAAGGDNGIGVAGVCYDCRIIPVKVFYYVNNPFGDPLPFSQGTSMADAISWAWQVGGADVLSNSWGIPDNLIPILPGGSAVVENAIRMAQDSGRGGKGALLFFSSGNDGGKPIWPGRLPGCFSVNATSMCDQRKHPGSCDGQNWEGNWGDSLDVSAPGVRVATTDMTGADGYDPSDYNLTFGGTSAACPNAAGVMGLILSVNPDLDLWQAHWVMESTCDRVGGYNYTANGASGTWSDELGFGRVNAHAAVLAAQNFVSLDPAPVAGFEMQLRPNPATEWLELSFSLEKSAPVEWEMRDLSGKLIYQEKMGQLPPRSYSRKIAVQEIFPVPGMIFLTLNVSGHQITKKVLIIN